MKKISNYLWGIVFIVIGCILGLNALKITNINIFFRGFWTLFIIVPCFIGLFDTKEKTGNIIGIIIGGLLLLMCQDFIDFSVVCSLIVPIILIACGLSLFFKDSFHKKIKKEIKQLGNQELHEYCATFSGQNLNFKDEEFTGCELTSIFGGIKCNLEKCELKDNALIKASAIFGGIDIIVPDDVLVKVVSTSIFGGVNNKRSNVDSKKVLYVEASCLFGGVDIK